MQEVAQLSQFDDELYKVENFLILNLVQCTLRSKLMNIDKY